jgi:hypothetical protein
VIFDFDDRFFNFFKKVNNAELFILKEDSLFIIVSLFALVSVMIMHGLFAPLTLTKSEWTLHELRNFFIDSKSFTPQKPVAVTSAPNDANARATFVALPPGYAAIHGVLETLESFKSDIGITISVVEFRLTVSIILLNKLL